MRFALLFLILLIAPVYADEGAGLTFYPHLEHMSFDADYNLDSDTHGGLGIGYRFEGPWALELVIQRFETDYNDKSTDDVDFDYWRLDSLYYLEPAGKWSPFLSFGAGRADFDLPTGNDEHEIQLNLGVGFKRALTDRTFLRTDMKLFNKDTTEASFSIGLHYSFGALPLRMPTTAPAPAPAPAPARPVQKPVIEEPRDRDDDLDGVANHRDKCPNTTNHMARIDENGCYVMQQSLTDIKLNVEFDFDSAEPRKGHAQEVGRVADFMEEHPRSVVVMEGHTDSFGTIEYNQTLSERRAQAIADMLTDRFGITMDRVSSTGFGETLPVATNETEAGRQQNRHVSAAVEAEKEELMLR